MTQIRNKHQALRNKYAKDLHYSLEHVLASSEMDRIASILLGIFAVALLLTVFVILARYYLLAKLAQEESKILAQQAAEVAAFSHAVNVYLEPQKCFEVLLNTFEDWFRESDVSIYLFESSSC